MVYGELWVFLSTPILMDRWVGCYVGCIKHITNESMRVSARSGVIGKWILEAPVVLKVTYCCLPKMQVQMLCRCLFWESWLFDKPELLLWLFAMSCWFYGGSTNVTTLALWYAKSKVLLRSKSMIIISGCLLLYWLLERSPCFVTVCWPNGSILFWSELHQTPMLITHLLQMVYVLAVALGWLATYHPTLCCSEGRFVLVCIVMIDLDILCDWNCIGLLSYLYRLDDSFSFWGAHSFLAYDEGLVLTLWSFGGWWRLSVLKQGCNICIFLGIL